MFWFRCLLLFLVLGPGLGAQDLGRTDRLWRHFLAETVRRGLPVLASEPALIPYWPQLQRYRLEAAALEPSDDSALIGAWIDLHEGLRSKAALALQNRWPSPVLHRFSPGVWAEALFASWDWQKNASEWTKAWLAWSDKAYYPRALVRGLEVLELTDTSAVVPLLTQAARLYPEDRRLLPLIARHPTVVASAQGLLARDRTATGGLGAQTIRVLLDRSPAARDLLVRAGYPETSLNSAGERDYGSWLRATPAGPPADGGWGWDADQDGRRESQLVFSSGQLVTWSRQSPGQGLWTVGFQQGLPVRVTEVRGGTRWTLDYEGYPLAKTLEYSWSDQRLVYRFPPLALSLALWPPERLNAPQERLPEALASAWMPRDLGVLARGAATIESWTGLVKTRTVFVVQGEVWMAVEDTDHDGKDDTWSYYRSGVLSSVYRDLEGRGRASLRELYRRGELTQVQSRAETQPRVEFALFPADGVQLWDPHGDLRPLDRIFAWNAEDRAQALVFSGSELPWDTMPPWEPRP